MVRISNWGLALTASILAMLNFGTCCCALGLPAGIWSLVILLQPDVKDAFARAQAGQTINWQRIGQRSNKSAPL